jgi:hypothetical protein
LRPKDPDKAAEMCRKISYAVKNASDLTTKRKSDSHKGKRKDEEFINKIKTYEAKICSKCGMEKHKSDFGKCARNKSGLQDWCKSCKHDHYEENKNEISKKKKKYCFENKDVVFEQHRRYREKNKEIISLKKKLDYVNNQELYITKAREYYFEHRDYILNRTSEYQKLHKEEKKKYDLEYRNSVGGFEVRTKSANKRRRNIKNKKCTLTLKQWNEILKMQNHTCSMCGRKFDKNLKPTKDHIIPISNLYCPGLTFGNTQALCGSCNSKKNKNVDFMKAISELIYRGE